MNLIGVDIGGSHISSARVEGVGSQVQTFDFFESEVGTFGTAEEIISAWTRVIRLSAGNRSDVRIGIAMPGPYDYPNGISLIKDQGKMKTLYGFSVKNLLAESLQISPDRISFTNDAEAFLLGESFAGAGQGFQNSMGLTLGTGLGSAIKINDVVKDGMLWTAPFRSGIAEDYLGSKWFKQYTFRKFGLSITGVKDLLSPEFDPESAKQVFEEFGESLGEFLSFYIIRLQCQGVVLGGKIARAADWFLPATQAYLDKLDYPLEIRIAQLEEKAALIGACIPFVSPNHSNQL